MKAIFELAVFWLVLLKSSVSYLLERVIAAFISYNLALILRKLYS